MSYEDIEEARAKRAAKEVIKGKGKRRIIEAPEPWRAPVARMY